jgi:hypothetical protein
MLSFYLILEFASGVMILSSIMLRDQQLQYFALFVILKLITTAQKNKILTDRFAPDLIAYNSTKFSFAFVQLLLSGIVFLGFGITLFAASSLIPDMDLLDRTKLVGLILIIFYINFISDLSLAALGKGVGVFGHSYKIRTLFGNIKDLANIKGKQSIPLAVLRLLNWVVIYYLLINQEMYTLLVPYLLISLFYQVKWEKINSASLFMEIRGEISNGKPAVLPNRLISEEDRETQLSNRRDYNHITNLIRGVSKNNGKRNNEKMANLNNLGPIAAKSISRIAKSIQHEEASIPQNMLQFCNNCSMEVIKASNFCSYCGERFN